MLKVLLKSSFNLFSSKAIITTYNGIITELITDGAVFN